jgi:diadenylate cyclase
MPKIQVIDVIEIIIIAVIFYLIMNWIQRTRAYNLLKGLLVIIAFVVIAVIFQMTTIIWLMQRVASVALLTIVIIFQPELRKALEQLGQRQFMSRLLGGRESVYVFSDNTINEIVHAATEMSAERTGALIVIEQKVRLDEYINTGIEIDAKVSNSLLENIFEEKTPLHDGAVVIRGDRIVAATCYLPLSESDLIHKRYGTRHRAAVGISEVSDCFAIIISEETGRISYAYKSELVTGISISNLREMLYRIQKVTGEREKRKLISRERR